MTVPTALHGNGVEDRVQFDTAPVQNGTKMHAKEPLIEGLKIAEPTQVNGTSPWIHATSSPYTKPGPALVDRFIDEPRSLRVAVLGGGLSGVLAGILLPSKVPGIKLTIYEKNADFGGAWFENVYPGVRCDVPSHAYQSTFAPKLDWSDQYAPGSEIRDYWQATARKYGVYEHAKFHHEAMGAQWNEEESVWEIKLQKTDGSKEIVLDKADYVLLATGRFNHWKLPNYPGISDYKGLLRHAANWDPSFDPTGKRVAVIGNGASGIQVVPSLQKIVSQLDHYARSRTWVAVDASGHGRSTEPQPYPEEQVQSFEDPETYLTFRKDLENKQWRRFSSFFRNAEANEDQRQRFTDVMKERLAKRPELLRDMVPDFSPNCRRLTPGPGYLEALTEDNVAYIRTPIKRFTETGIETEDGAHRDVDAIFCATGANNAIPIFPIVAKGRNLADIWDPDGEYGFSYTYLGLATPGFPNFGFVHGPHGSGPSGTTPHSVENQLTYFAKLLRKMSREGIKAVEPSEKAADDFVEYSDAFFKTTVHSDNCSSWYNGGRPGGRVHGIWPGSAGHLTIIRREPRWEDWNYEYLAENGNRFLWYFGNGWSRKETEPDSDMTTYLQADEVDLRDVHECWWNVP